MIFNKDKVIHVLFFVIYHCPELSRSKIQTLQTLIAYFEQEEPKLTFEEFKLLFDCKGEYKKINERACIDIKITPKNTCRLYIDESLNFSHAFSEDFGIRIDPEIEEDIKFTAYREFVRHVESLNMENKDEIY